MSDKKADNKLKYDITDNSATDQNESAFLPPLKQAQQTQTAQWGDDQDKKHYSNEKLNGNVRYIYYSHNLSLRFYYG